MVARVFPRKTKASPTDPLAYFGGPGLFPPSVAEVHISVSFEWDIPFAVEYLARQWQGIAPVKIGGPAFGEPGGEFIPGQYLREGYVITSRGCPNACWFCEVWKREGREVKTLPVRDGWNVLDDNLLACPEDHIRKVFAMLQRQKHRAEFTGGLEAARLRDWHINLLADLKPAQMFFAYDTPEDLDPLLVAGESLKKAGFTRRSLRCYVLIGFPGDTFQDAEKRLWETVGAGFFPMAMLYRHGESKARDWSRLQRAWARPASIYRLTVNRPGV